MGAAAVPLPERVERQLDIGALPQPFAVASWETDSGLPQNTVRAIRQTADGHLWVGTSEGLARFNGSEFTVFNRRNTPGFPNSSITTLLETPDGSLWFGSDGSGVARVREGKVERFPMDKGLLSPRVFALALGPDGSVWVGTASGVSRWRDGKFEHTTEREGLVRNLVRSLRFSRTGELWVGTTRGVSVIRDGVVSTDTSLQDLSSDIIRVLFEDKAGARWIVTNSEVARQQGGVLIRYAAKHGIAPQNVESIVEGQDGTLWFGASDGLFRFQDGRFVREVWQGSARESIRTVFADREGNLWLGTNGGLKRIRRTVFAHYGVEEGLSHDMVASVCQDASGAYWVGTMGGGLNRLSGRSQTVYTKKHGLLSAGIRALHPSRDGGIWVGFDRSGVVRIQEGQVNRHTSIETFDGSTAQALHEDRNGTLWIGTRNGLCSLKDGQFVNHTKNGGIEANIIRDFAEGADGVLWIGTSRGLVRHESGRFTLFRKEQGLASDSIRSLYIDRDGVLWIGTNGGGLNWLQQGKFGKCSLSRGLYSDTIFEVIDDDIGYLWMSSRQGMFRVAKQRLLEVGRGERARVECMAFGKADGLPGVEGSGVAKPGAWKAADGRLWFATLKGVATIDPTAIKRNEIPPPVVITRLRVDGADVPLDRVAHLPPGRGEFDCSYTALSYTQPEKIRYKYKLEGVNDDWVDAGTRVVANYSRLPPGRHRFVVRAMNSDGVWNETGAAVEFHLAPHFYTTWWFYSILGGMICSAAFGAYSLRMRALRKRERQLVTIVQERTAHLETEIHERRRAEEALKGSEALYHSLVEALPVSIHRKDNDGRFTFANHHFCTRLGRPLADVLQRTDDDLYSAEVATKHRMADQRVRETREAFQCEEAACEPGGAVRYFDTFTVPVFDGSGELAGTQGLSWDITPRKRAEQEVAKAHRELVEVSRLAGMAEVATGVLHNVGNVLNSVNVSATLLEQRARESKVASVARLSGLLREQGADLGSFLTSDPKGRTIPAYLERLAAHLADDQAAMVNELELLRKHIDHIKNIVARQQSFANVCRIRETLAIADLVEEALQMSAGTLARHGIELVRDYTARPTLLTEKHKVVQIIVNLITNAQQACVESERTKKTIVVRIAQEEDRVRVSVADNGVGIPKENLTRIFAHGFTTRPDGHGFGLHSSALVAKELGGSLIARSDGPGLGAEFVLEVFAGREAIGSESARSG